jgi:dolichol kinase
MEQTFAPSSRFEPAQTSTATPAVDVNDPRAILARRVFLGALVFNIALTLFWVWLFVSGGSTVFYTDYRLSLQSAAGVLAGVAFFYIAWGLPWWGLKALLLRKWVGLTKEETRDAFSSRMDRPYDVAVLTAKYSERRIRIADRVGRRGRFALMAFGGLFGLYLQRHDVAKLGPDFAVAFAANNVLEAVIGGWFFLSLFYVNGFVGAATYGPQSRIMDGMLGRANNLLITTLWGAFKFVMVPLSILLARFYPPEQFAVVFGLIWLSYITTDAFAEIFGSLLGKQTIKVWGVGDVNRKSVAGVVAGFSGALIVNLLLISANGLMAGPWIALAVTIAASNCLVELYSPRGTDDFTMATTNALLCLAFGAWVI